MPRRLTEKCCIHGGHAEPHSSQLYDHARDRSSDGNEDYGSYPDDVDVATPEAADRVLLFNKVVKSNRRPNINTTWRIQESHYRTIQRLSTVLALWTTRAQGHLR